MDESLLEILTAEGIGFSFLGAASPVFPAIPENVSKLTAICCALEPVGLGNRRLQIDRTGPFFTVFLTHSGAMELQIRQKLFSLGPIFACQMPQVRQAPRIGGL